MKIFIMRHGEAEHYAPSDAERALTQRGRSASVSVAKSCVEQGFQQFDKVIVSPYLRAQQTWFEISKHFDAKQVLTSDDITPYGDSEDVFEYINALIDVDKLDSVLLVSHLPLVGYLTAEFVTDMAPPMFPTSGLICIDYSPESRNGQVAFNIQPQ
ncbi:phosphohistidine phosphatase SixA [Vibrio atypicus]|uniref:phosphohistidine phosphatase SixA n=1 Tax=Vibrio atypicus TaxID=558271 RepID=UPI00135A39B4|nr:phosphohistidine phosphatase SixA [Vibrio atypicus]